MACTRGSGCTCERCCASGAAAKRALEPEPDGARTSALRDSSNSTMRAGKPRRAPHIAFDAQCGHYTSAGADEEDKGGGGGGGDEADGGATGGAAVRVGRGRKQK